MGEATAPTDEEPGDTSDSNTSSESHTTTTAGLATERLSDTIIASATWVGSPERYVSGDLQINDNHLLRIGTNRVGSREIARHSIEAEDIDTNSITGRTIRNQTIDNQDINDHIDLLANSVTAQTLTATESLTVADLVVSGTLDPDFSAGSIVFQGSNGLAQDNQHFFWDDTNNRLGVNTHAPVETLDIAGRLHVAQTTAPTTTTDRLYNVGGNLLWNGINLTGGGSLPSGSTGQTLYHTGSSWAVSSLLTNTGSAIGIGDTTPSAALTVGSGDLFQVNSSGAIASATGITSSGTFTLSDLSTGILHANASGILSSSFVDLGSADVTGTLPITAGGTGTTTANAALNVFLPTQTGNVSKFLQTDGSNTSWARVELSDLADPTTDTALNLDSHTLTLTYGASTGTSDLFTITDTAGNTGIGSLVDIETATGSLVSPLHVSASNGVFEALFVDSSGNIGLGTTSPYSKLTVSGGTTIGSGYATTALSDGDLAVEGQVGIGTDAPSALLHILGTTTQLTLAYDASNYWTDTVASDGGRTLVASGTDADLHIDLSGATDGDFAINTNQFFLDTDTGNLGIGTATPSTTLEVNGDISQTCATGYVWVPGSAKYGTLPGFCVMKYEAKNSSGSAVSTPTGNPWVSISQETARTTCQAIGTGYHLISEAEWMTIAENIANTSINDLDTDASLQLATGHSDNAPGSALATTAAADPATSGCDLTQELEDTSNAYSAGSCEIRGDGSYGGDDTDKGYYGTGQAYATAGYSAGGSNNQSQLRTHILSNGNTLWDIAGNVWEWIDQLALETEVPTDATPAIEWLEYTAITAYQSYPNVRPPDDGWDSTNGIGKLYSQDGDAPNTRAFIRGGNWAYGANDGVFALYLGDSPALTGTVIGFRCSR